MPKSNAPMNTEFGESARYRIVVKGELSEVSRSRFDGMDIETMHGEGAASHTILTGNVRDQAELRGVLDALYGLHLSVVAVERCNGD